MSRKTLTKTRALVGTVALVGTFVAVAGSASAYTATITKTTTQKAPLNTSIVLGVIGSGFEDDIDYVSFTSGAAAACGTTAVQVISATQLYVKTPASGCTAGVQTIKLFTDGAGSTGRVATGPTAAASTVTFTTPPVLATTDPVLPATASILGGSAATATVTTALPATSTVQVFIGGTAAAGKVIGDGTKISFKVPSGKPGKASIKVVANGLSSATLPASDTNAFTYKSALKLTPSVWVKDAATPQVKIDGLNFKPTLASGTNTAPTVTFCGVAGTVVTTGTKAYTDKVLYVAPPAWNASFPANTVTAADGGVCTVKVSVDEDGNGAGTTNTDSVVTAGSSFTYAAY